MKRKILSLMIGICAVTVIATACGTNTANYTTSSSSSVSGGVISDAAVSESFVQAGKNEQERERKYGKTDIKKLRYANDCNIFEGDRDKGVYQYDLKGKEEQYYDLDIEIGGEELSFTHPEVLWVDNDWVFISCHRSQEYYEIWRIPVNQENGEKRLTMKKKEKLVKVKRLYALITKTDQEIIYCADEKIVRLDLQTRKTKKLETGIQEGDIEIVLDNSGIPFVQDGKAYYNDMMEEEMYQIDLERWKIVSMGMSTDGTIASDERSLYFRTEGLIKYDKETGKKKTLISEEELTEKIENTDAPKVKGGKKFGAAMDDYLVKPIYHQDDRLYLTVQVTYEASGEKDEDDAGVYAELMFSCLASDGSDFRYEKKLTEYVWEHSVPYTEGAGEVLLEELTGNFTIQLDGCIVLHFYEEELPEEEDYELKNHHRFVLYDLRDGTFREVKKPSDEYGYIKALGYTFFEEAHC